MTGPESGRQAGHPHRLPAAAGPPALPGDVSAPAPEALHVPGQVADAPATEGRTTDRPPSPAAPPPPAVDPYAMVALAVAAPVVLAILAVLVWVVLRWVVAG
jgi:hypothetical protein